jgi:hypothetical protein
MNVRWTAFAGPGWSSLIHDDTIAEACHTRTSKAVRQAIPRSCDALAPQLAMYTFVVREMSYGALLPFARPIERMHLSDVASWRFHWIDLHGGGCPFGMTFDEFEAASRVPGGLEVRDSEFRAFLNSDFQVVEGEIEAWSNDVAPICLARIDCHDASEWELTTDIPEVASRLEQSGFPRA